MPGWAPVKTPSWDWAFEKLGGASLPARWCLVQGSLTLHSYLLLPFLLTNITGKRWAHDMDLLPQPGVTSWGSELMLDIPVNGTLCDPRTFHFLLPLCGTVHDLQLSPLSWISLCVWHEWGCQGTRTRERGKNTELGQSSHEPDEGKVSFCVWSCSISKSRILMKEEKNKCNLLIIKAKKH